MKQTLLSWSSGKDSAWALYMLRKNPDINVAGLFPLRALQLLGKFLFSKIPEINRDHGKGDERIHQKTEGRSPAELLEKRDVVKHDR